MFHKNGTGPTIRPGDTRARGSKGLGIPKFGIPVRGFAHFYGFGVFHRLFNFFFPGYYVGHDRASFHPQNPHLSNRDRIVVLSTRRIVDPTCTVPEGYFRGVLHCFGRGETPGRHRTNNISKKKSAKIDKKAERNCNLQKNIGAVQWNVGRPVRAVGNWSRGYIRLKYMYSSQELSIHHLAILKCSESTHSWRLECDFSILGRSLYPQARKNESRFQLTTGNSLNCFVQKRINWSAVIQNHPTQLEEGRDKQIFGILAVVRLSLSDVPLQAITSPCRLEKENGKSERSQNIQNPPGTINFGRSAIEGVCLKAEYTLTIQNVPWFSDIIWQNLVRS